MREPFLDVRRTAALDMALHGDRLIIVEFAFGVAACAVLGALSILGGVKAPAHGLSRQLALGQLALGIVLIGVALNYLPLLVHAIDIGRKRSASTEATAELAKPELLRRYTVRQFLLLVPFAVGAMALAQWRRMSDYPVSRA
jgi:hypothetical protein